MSSQVQFASTNASAGTEPGLLASGAGTPAGDDSVATDDFSALLEAGMMAAAAALTPAPVTVPEALPEGVGLGQALTEAGDGEAGEGIDITSALAAGLETAMPTAAAPASGNAENTAPRRSNLGGLMEEDFPEGWETLLEDNASSGTPVVAAPAAPTAAPAALADDESGLFEFAGAVQANPVPAPAASAAAAAKPKSAVPTLAAETPAAQAHAEAASAAPTADAAAFEAKLVEGNDQAPAARERTPQSASATRATAVSQEGDVEKKAQGAHAKHESFEATSATAMADVHSALSKAELASGKSAAASIGSAKGLQAMNEMQKQMVVTDFVQSTLHSMSGGNETLSVDLHPPELGPIKVVIESNGNQINAHLTAQQQDVGDLFRQNTDTIRQSLESAGIKVGDLSVEVGPQYQQAAGERETPTQQTWAASRASADPSKAETVTAAAGGSTPGLASGRLDIVV